MQIKVPAKHIDSAGRCSGLRETETANGMWRCFDQQPIANPSAPHSKHQPCHATRGLDRNIRRLHKKEVLWRSSREHFGAIPRWWIHPTIGIMTKLF